MKQRRDGRALDQMRPVVISPGVNPYAEGSAEIRFGSTCVHITASVEFEVPKWKAASNSGWITAEYGMLPRSTHSRNKREAGAGKQSGRTLEIQRLIGRALRQSIPMESIPGITITLDCDVLVADGGTRTAAISGAWIALYQAVLWAKKQGLVAADVNVSPIAAVSVGIVAAEKLVDLAYEEDSAADFDLNLVFTGAGELIEIQGTAERAPLTPAVISELIELGVSSIVSVFDEQRRVLNLLESF